MWWSKFTNTRKEVETPSKSTSLISYIAVILVTAALFFYVRQTNNAIQDSSVKVWGFNYPFNYPEYSNNSAVKDYSDFMKSQNMSPKDYIMYLFEKHDIIILSETYHGESTQWELISEIVKDKRFINKVGHVFTEYGGVRQQHKVNLPK